MQARRGADAGGGAPGQGVHPVAGGIADSRWAPVARGAVGATAGACASRARAPGQGPARAGRNSPRTRQGAVVAVATGTGPCQRGGQRGGTGHFHPTQRRARRPVFVCAAGRYAAKTAPVAPERAGFLPESGGWLGQIARPARYARAPPAPVPAGQPNRPGCAGSGQGDDGQPRRIWGVFVWCTPGRWRGSARSRRRAGVADGGQHGAAVCGHARWPTWPGSAMGRRAHPGLALGCCVARRGWTKAVGAAGMSGAGRRCALCQCPAPVPGCGPGPVRPGTGARGIARAATGTADRPGAARGGFTSPLGRAVAGSGPAARPSGRAWYPESRWRCPACTAAPGAHTSSAGGAARAAERTTAL